MRITRIYQPTELSEHREVILDKEASHHLLTVLRKSVGETITVFNGKGKEYNGTITAINNKIATVTLNSLISSNPESPLKLHLVQSGGRAFSFELYGGQHCNSRVEECHSRTAIELRLCKR